MELLDRLNLHIEMADHKPGQWFVCKIEGCAVCGCAEHKKRSLLGGLLSPHDFIGREFQRNDLRLAVEAVNALPELLALAQDGLKYRAQASRQPD
jgi:hypothetical protein